MEIEEAALVDGASRLRAVRSILLPLARTGILAAGVVVFAFDWSEFLFAFILSATPQSMTFPVGVQGLVTQFEIIWNDMAAGGVIAIIAAAHADDRGPSVRHHRPDLRCHPREVAAATGHRAACTATSSSPASSPRYVGRAAADRSIWRSSPASRRSADASHAGRPVATSERGSGAEGGTRTHTRLAPPRCLRPLRLPIPPLRRGAGQEHSAGWSRRCEAR